MPSITFQIDYAAMGDRLRAYRMGAGLQADEVAEKLGVSRALMQSPFRLGELPNVRNGIATAAFSAKAVALHEQMTTWLWAGASKGKEGAARLRAMLERIHSKHERREFLK